MFDKSRTLYALHAARNAIRDQKVAVIVEGYMDALAAHQFGFANVVASLGTALTEQQFKQLQKLAAKIVLALDPDTAGINAMLRGLDVARESLDREMQPLFNPRGLVGHAAKLQIDIRVLVLPNEQDPDEVMRADPNQWRTLVDAAQPVVQFVIDTLTAGRDLNDPRIKTAIANEALPIIRDVANPVEQSTYIQQLARRLKVDERAMFDQMRVAMSKPPRSKRPAPSKPELLKRDTTDIEQYCLSIVLRQPHTLPVIDEALARAEQPPLNGEDFEQVQNREVFQALRAALSNGQAPQPDDIRSELDATLHDHLTMLLTENQHQPALSREDSLEQAAQQAGLRLRERRLRREGRELHALLEDAQSDAAPANLEEIYQTRQSNAAALLRLQQMLASRTIIRQSTVAPWSRS